MAKQRKKAKVAEKAASKFYIIWCPTSDKPPRKRFTKVKAEEVARIMVEKYHTSFFVMQSTSLHVPGSPVRIPYTGREVKEKPVKGPSILMDIESRNSRGQPVVLVGTNPCPNAFKSWDSYQDIRLKKLFRQGNSLQQIATQMGRTMLAIQYRLDHLNLQKMSEWEKSYG